MSGNPTANPNSNPTANSNSQSNGNPAVKPNTIGRPNIPPPPARIHTKEDAEFLQSLHRRAQAIREAEAAAAAAAIANPTSLVIKPRPLTMRESQLVDHLVRLQLFLAIAPGSWQQYGTIPSGTEMYPMQNPWATFPGNQSSDAISFVSSPHPALNRFLLPNGEHVTCAYWNGLFQITGTDIVRALAFRFEAFGRPVKTAMVKKFEEGVFSDLRNLKPGEDAALEKPKSEFLDLLFKYGCIRTQKKQKVFYWFSVPHDRLFLDALERDLKREKEGQDTTTEVIGEPARSFRWDPSRTLFEQYAASEPGSLTHIPHTVYIRPDPIPETTPRTPLNPNGNMDKGKLLAQAKPSGINPANNPASTDTVSLFEGSPAYKQRKKRGLRDSSLSKLEKDAKTGDAGHDEDADEEGSFSEEDSAPGSVTRTPRTASTAFPFLPPRTQPAPPVDKGKMRAIPPNGSHAQSPANSDTRDESKPLIGRPRAQAYPPGMRPHPMAFMNTMGAYPNHLPMPLAGTKRTFSQSTHEADYAESGGSISDVGSPNEPWKAFMCPLQSCRKTFKRLEHLKRHIRTHTEERPYECTKCQKRFSRGDNLMQHLKIHDKMPESGEERAVQQ